MTTALTTCMSSFSSLGTSAFVNKVSAYYLKNQIDNPAYLKNGRVYIYSGTGDTTVRSSEYNFFFNYIWIV